MIIISIVCIVLGWLTLMSIFLVTLTEQQYLRVFSFVKMALNRIPFTSIVKALKAEKKIINK